MLAIVPSARSPKTRLFRPSRQANPVGGSTSAAVDDCVGFIGCRSKLTGLKRWAGNVAIDETAPDSSCSGHTLPVAQEELLAEVPENLPPSASRVAQVYPDIWNAFAALGQACSEAGSIEAHTLRFVRLALAIGALSEGAVHLARCSLWLSLAAVMLSLETSSTYAAFRVRCIQPLCHLSGVRRA